MAAVLCLVMGATAAAREPAGLGPGTSAMPFGAASSAPASKNVEASLLADRNGIAPGESVTLAIQVKIASGWHIYWRSPGDTGMPTKVAWQVPPGFVVGPTEYPTPRLYVDSTEGRSFILEGQPVLLASLQAPATAKSGEELAISAEVKWLVCKEQCQPGTQKVSLSLPVVAAGASKAANETLFTRARNAMPLPAEKAKYLARLFAIASVDRVSPGQAFKVAVVLQIQDGHHINAHKVTSELQIPTELFPDVTESLEIDAPVYPAGKVENSPLPGEKVSVYRDRVVIVLPVRAQEAPATDPEGNRRAKQEVRVSGLVRYQACNDKTQQCFPPVAAEWSLTLPVAAAGEAVAEVNKDVFAALPQPEAVTTTGPAADEAEASAGGAGSEDAGGGDGQVITSTTWIGRTAGMLARMGLFGYLIMAFVGGLILNLMPCVLPVISIKIVSFVQQAKHSRLRVFTLGMAFSLGIFLSFIVLGIMIVFLGQQWGGLFQRPQVVIALTAVVTAFALSLFGVYTILPPRFIGDLGQFVPQEGHLGAFGMGLLATVLGTACTAPFLSVVVAVAAQQPQAVGMLIFIVAGVGMALPYVLLAAHPAWLRVIPKPGPWMQTFEQAMGFLLLVTAVWLLNTVNAQLGGRGLIWTLLFLLSVAAGVWFYGRAGLGASMQRKAFYYGSAALVIAGGWWLCFHRATTIDDLLTEQNAARRAMVADLGDQDWSGRDIPWIPYTRERVEAAVRAGWTVFIDYTAEWCVNCKANEIAFINTKPVREVMQRLGVLPFRADWTSRDPEITTDLEKYGRSGVPMYLVIPANRPEDVMLLDEVPTAASIISALEKAGASSALQREEGVRAAGEISPVKPAEGEPARAGAAGP